jgi:hypothetical protein
MEVDALMRTEYFPPLLAQVEQELAAVRDTAQAERPALERQLAALNNQIRGWKQTLGNPDLSNHVRTSIEEDFDRAAEQVQVLEGLLNELDRAAVSVRDVVDPREVAHALTRLEDMLLWENPTLSNLELSLHIDHICCHPDGRVVVRTNRLGALAGVAPRLAKTDGGEGVLGEAAEGKVKNRRRAMLKVDDLGPDGESARAGAYYVADPNRFAGLGPEWFWEDEYRVPDPPVSWAVKNAAAVAAKRAETGWNYPKLMEHFGVGKASIKAAMKHARKTDAAAAAQPARARPGRWEDTHWNEVARAKADDKTIAALARRFGKSPPTIVKALRLAEKKERERLDAILDESRATG